MVRRKRKPPRHDGIYWLMMGMIGFTVGFIGFLLHNVIDAIEEPILEKALELAKEGKIGIVWCWRVGMGVILATLSSIIIVYFRPSAGGSGIPELIAFLNGTSIRHIYNVRTLLAKFASCAFAVSAGLFAGPEGPMIHIGALVGAGLSQFKSDSMGINLAYFQRFRNPEDRRNFISAGAAAGVSSAFGAPVGGLLFSMEEVSSFWSNRLTWQVFFCSMIAAFTTNIFNSAFLGFHYQGYFGLLKESNILFKSKLEILNNIIIFIPTICLGILGGGLGSLFVFMNLKIVRLRDWVETFSFSSRLKKLFKIVEVIIIITLTATISTTLPLARKCQEPRCFAINAVEANKITQESCSVSYAGIPHPMPPVTGDMGAAGTFDCMAHLNEVPIKTGVSANGKWRYTNQTYNELSSLLYTSQDHAINQLLSRGTHKQYSPEGLLYYFIPYFFLACWTSTASLSVGLVMPMLTIGALYGRMIGELLVIWFGEHFYYGDKYSDASDYKAWMDPGAIALIGAASFFAGVSRLTISLTVIMIEITNDVTMLLPIMTAIMVAKIVGDQLTHPIYHALLEVKCIPILDEEPVVYTQDPNGRSVLRNLELHTVSEVMTRTVTTLNQRVNVSDLASSLKGNKHMSFPVLDDKGYCGTINRIDLIQLLQHRELFQLPDEPQRTDVLKFHSVHTDKLHDDEDLILDSAIEHGSQKILYILPYTNRSSIALPDSFSLHRAYLLLRTLGIRVLVLLDDRNMPSGILTRKDLMGFAVEEKLQASITRSLSESDPNTQTTITTVTTGINSIGPCSITGNKYTLS